MIHSQLARELAFMALAYTALTLLVIMHEVSIARS
jgi:hypothetical protein